MNNTQKIKNQRLQIIQSNPKTILVIMLLLLTTSCASVDHRRENAKKILQHEKVVLMALKKEREGENVASHLKVDPLLLRAENHLKQAIEALLRANKTAESSL